MNLPLARYRFTFTVTRDIHLPAYAGSMLRGAFGHALRGVACMTRQKECAGCPLQTTCPYPAVFAPVPPSEHALQKFSQIPVPYVIEPEHSAVRHYTQGETFRFDMVLMGRALAELPLIILAWRRALARGLGKSEGTGELDSVSVMAANDEETTVFTPNVGQIQAHTALTVWPDDNKHPSPDWVELHFITPLRLQENGKALPPNRLTPRALLMALVRRTHLLAEFHLGGARPADFSALGEMAANIVSQPTDIPLHWQDWTRYSSRQGQSMKLGGVIGKWRLSGDLAPFMPYLKLGTMLHIGKEAAFGLGYYRLSEHNFSKPLQRRECVGQPTDFVEEIT